MILAAGLGTRLRPLTNDRPKALVQVKGMPLLEIVIRRLKYFGFEELIINTHHFAGLVANFLASKNNFGLRIEISHENEKLLNTGGGLKKASWFFDDGQPFLLCNTDILTDLNPLEFFKKHQQTAALVTLATRHRSTSRYLLFDQEKKLCGWTNIKTGEVLISRAIEGTLQLRAFSGWHIIDPKLFDFFPAEEEFSIIDTYLDASGTADIYSYEHDNSIWLDVGKPDTLSQATDILSKIPIKLD